MARARPAKTNFTGGELAPSLGARTDLVAYRNGARRLRNVLVVPTGGVRRRPGLRHIGRLLNQLSVHALTSGMFSVTNGGTTASLVDGGGGAVFTTTTNLSTTATYVVWTLDFGSGQSAMLLDVEGLSITAGTASESFQLQGSANGSAWSDIGGRVREVGTAAITRRWRIGQAWRYVRLVRFGPADLGTAKVSVGEVRAWDEAASLSAVQIIEFSFSLDQRYIHVLTDRNIAVYKDGLFQRDVPVPYLSSQVRAVAFTQNLDTLLLFHPDVAPFWVLRAGDDDEWNIGDWELKNIPKFDFGAGPPGVDEVQEMQFRNFTGADTYNLQLGGERTSTIFWDGGTDTDRDRIRDALRGLPGTSDTGITVTRSGSNFTITFTGDDGSQDQPEISPAIQEATNAAAEIRLATRVEGEPGGEPVWSVTRGWPVCGTFFGGRLWFAGSRSRPQTLWSTRVGDYHDFNSKRTDDDYGINVTADTNDISAFQQIFPGRHLQVFATSAEFYVPVSDTEPVTPSNIVLRRTSTRGIKPATRVFEVAGATMFLQRGGKALREFLFVDTEQAYQAENLALLSSHLLTDPVSIALRQATSTEDADYLWVVNGNGTLAAFCTLRLQDVNAWTLSETEGLFRAVGVSDTDTYFAVERSVGGTASTWLEMFDDALLVDAGLSGGVASGIAGATWLEGEEAEIILDGAAQPRQEVAGGALTFARASADSYQVGRPWPLVDGDTAIGRTASSPIWVQTLRAEEALPEGTQIGRKKRVVEVTAQLLDTTSAVINDNLLAFQAFDAMHLDTAPAPFTGDMTMPCSGWDEYGFINVTQAYPGRLNLLGLAYTLAV